MLEKGGGGQGGTGPPPILEGRGTRGHTLIFSLLKKFEISSIYRYFDTCITNEHNGLHHYIEALSNWKCLNVVMQHISKY